MEKNMEDVIERAKKIKLVIFDVHGVLTNNTVLYNDNGERWRAFDHQDGFGVNCMMACGIEVAIITRTSKLAQARAKDIGIKRFYGTKEKVKAYQELLNELNITPEEVCYVGDEIIDLGVMSQVGLAVAPANAAKEAIEVAHYVTKVDGGCGVARELGEMMLRAQGKWDAFVDKVKSKGWG